MTKIGGWLLPKPQGQSSTRDKGRFGDYVRYLQPASSADIRRGYGVAGGADSHIVRDEKSDSLALIEGNFRWDDLVYAKVAASDGHARALLVAYRDRGFRMLSNLTGTFALAIADAPSNSVFLAIDRMGGRTMSYGFGRNGEMVFGSDARLVARHSSIDQAVSEQAIYDYLFFHVVPSPASIFTGIQKLEPAHFVELANGKHRTERYWSPQFIEPSVAGRGPSGAECLTRIRTAVSRCSPDQQTGAFLSGGLDSSTVCATANEQLDGKLRAYTIGFNQDGYDEMEFARIAGRHFGFDISELYVTPDDISQSAEELILAFDEPFGNSSAIPAYFCAKLAKSEGKTQLLAGDGGDELFGGNERYATQQLFDYYDRLPTYLKSYLVDPIVDRIPPRLSGPARKLRRYVEQARIPMPLRLYTYNHLMTTSTDEMFDPQFLRNIDVDAPKTSARTWYDRSEAAGLLDKMLAYDWKVTLADNDLRKVTRMCEESGITVRFPFLDEELVDFSTRIPAVEKIRRGELRFYYKEAMKGYLPSAILNKSKHGFGLPFGEWLKTSPALNEQFGVYLSRMKERGIFRSGYLARVQAQHQQEHAAYYGNLIWVICALEIWLAHSTAHITQQTEYAIGES